MPAHNLTRLVKTIWRIRQFIHNLVVKLNERQMELRDDRILVVAWIPDECALRVRSVSRQIVLARRVLADEQMNAVLIVEIWIVVRPIRIQRIKIKARRAEIAQGI